MKFQNYSLKKILKYSLNAARIFGLISFKYPSETCKISLIGSILFFVNLSLNVAQLYGFIILFSSSDNYSIRENDLTNFLVMISFAFALFCESTILILNFLMRKEIFDAIKKFEEFDFEVRIKKILILFKKNHLIG